jgi:hypothetical protein
LLWEDIDVNGVIGTHFDLPDHGELTCDTPIRVAPDGSVVVIGSGTVLDAISLMIVHELNETIADAAWGGGSLFTMQAAGGASALVKWSADYQPLATQPLPGSPLRVLAINEGLLAITDMFERPWFSIWDLDLNEIYQLPIYRVYLPLVTRNQ